MKRRLILTNELLVLALVDQEKEVDRIVLSEVDFIKEFISSGLGEEEAPEFRMLQIATNLHGFNSGRTYCLRMESDKFNNIMKTWSVCAQKARRRAEARTVFEKVQREIRGFYDSWIFQTVIALAIAAVRIVFCLRSKIGLR